MTKTYTATFSCIFELSSNKKLGHEKNLSSSHIFSEHCNVQLISLQKHASLRNLMVTPPYEIVSVIMQYLCLHLNTIQGCINQCAQESRIILTKICVELFTGGFSNQIVVKICYMKKFVLMAYFLECSINIITYSL